MAIRAYYLISNAYRNRILVKEELEEEVRQRVEESIKQLPPDYGMWAIPANYGIIYLIRKPVLVKKNGDPLSPKVILERHTAPEGPVHALNIFGEALAEAIWNGRIRVKEEELNAILTRFVDYLENPALEVLVQEAQQVVLPDVIITQIQTLLEKDLPTDVRNWLLTASAYLQQHESLLTPEEQKTFTDIARTVSALLLGINTKRTIAKILVQNKINKFQGGNDETSKTD
jgi:hypothetical protein